MTILGLYRGLSARNLVTDRTSVSYGTTGNKICALICDNGNCVQLAVK